MYLSHLTIYEAIVNLTLCEVNQDVPTFPCDNHQDGSSGALQGSSPHPWLGPYSWAMLLDKGTCTAQEISHKHDGKQTLHVSPAGFPSIQGI